MTGFVLVSFLFGYGFHGHNGLDPESLLHIYKTYITPVLLYGMELLLPSSKPLEQLELFQKRILKQILTLVWILCFIVVVLMIPK
jgi:hypothetical protein